VPPKPFFLCSGIQLREHCNQSIKDQNTQRPNKSQKTLLPSRTRSGHHCTCHMHAGEWSGIVYESASLEKEQCWGKALCFYVTMRTSIFLNFILLYFQFALEFQIWIAILHPVCNLLILNAFSIKFWMVPTMVLKLNAATHKCSWITHTHTHTYVHLTPQLNVFHLRQQVLYSHMHLAEGS